MDASMEYVLPNCPILQTKHALPTFLLSKNILQLSVNLNLKIVTHMIKANVPN